MALTLITPNIKILKTIEFQGQLPYFHPEDIAQLLNQDGAIAVALVKAEINDDPACIALIGVEKIDPNQQTGELAIVILDRPNLNFIGLPCPPYNNNGGVFELVPERQKVSDYIVNSTQKKAFEGNRE